MAFDEYAEYQALLGDREAVIRVVSALRKYRKAVKDLLDSRYGDGECDAVALCNFESECEDIEDELK